MRKIVLFGNSGSGKSTLAAELCSIEKLAHLDLDNLAWLPSHPPQRAPLESSNEKIGQFIENNAAWVIEGCYADLLELAANHAEEIIFLDLPIELCIENARNRPWEPHKYESKQDQDQNLDMLLDWISQYGERDDVFSRSAHWAFYEQFPGLKTVYTSNERET